MHTVACEQLILAAIILPFRPIDGAISADGEEVFQFAIGDERTVGLIEDMEELVCP